MDIPRLEAIIEVARLGSMRAAARSLHLGQPALSARIVALEDELGARVKRGSELIRLCRERLLKSRTEIEQVVADLETLDPAGEDSTRDASDEDTV